MVNKRQIEYILAVLREGSITAASKKLYLSQPALSQAIKQAETDLGVALFDRSTDPISLTYAGQRYVEAAQRILDIDRNLRTELAESSGEVHGRIAAFEIMLATPSIRSRIREEDLPAPLRGAPIVLISAALMSIAFMGFSGLAF